MGVYLYILISGKYPFEDQKKKKLLEKILYKDLLNLIDNNAVTYNIVNFLL